MKGADSTPRAFVALGSNLGEAVRLVSEAMDRLERLSSRPVLRSSLWRTKPVDCPPASPEFINAVAGLEPMPGETPESLLEKLQDLEREFGRVKRKERNEPRVLDLDLILFGAERRETKSLILPHPRAHARRFVLGPLAEIASGIRWPGQDRTVEELLRELPTDQ